MGNNNKPPIEEGPVVPQPVVQIRITLLNNGSLNVNGFPIGLDSALQIMQDAHTAIVKHFVQGAKDGKLDDTNIFIQNKIITPGNKVII